MIIIKKQNSKNLKHKKSEPVVVSTTATDEELVLQYKAESDFAVVETTPRERKRFKFLLFCFFKIDHTAVIAGARSKFPMNCGSIANPFGCGNPNIRYVHPSQSSEQLCGTPARSNTHCTTHHKHTTKDEPKNQPSHFFRN